MHPSFSLQWSSPNDWLIHDWWCGNLRSQDVYVCLCVLLKSGEEGLKTKRSRKAILWWKTSCAALVASSLQVVIPVNTREEQEKDHRHHILKSPVTINSSLVQTPCWKSWSQPRSTPLSHFMFLGDEYISGWGPLCDQRSTEHHSDTVGLYKPCFNGD